VRAICVPSPPALLRGYSLRIQKGKRPLNKEELVHAFPDKRIKPTDGMAVTAAVWEEAHDYHRSCTHFHNLLAHGLGILVGLEVIASDPPDSAVYIMPGIAIGTRGEFIVLKKPIAYDIGTATGILYLQLTYGEGAPRISSDPDQTEELLYIKTEFGIEAKSEPGDSAKVELARVRREKRDSPICDAQEPHRPTLNEVDLRFRREIGAQSHSPEVASMAVCYLGGKPDDRHYRGASALGRAIRHRGDMTLWVDDAVPISPELEYYDIVYLVGLGGFTLKKNEKTALRDYLAGGGTIFAESCWQKLAEKPQADVAFLDVWGGMNITLEDVQPGHPLLTTPYLFASATPGFVVQGEPRLLAGEGVIFSSHDYGCVWQGQQQGGSPSRETVRAAHEWGNNLVAYALHRRREAER
jgi:hypothetical protein